MAERNVDEPGDTLASTRAILHGSLVQATRDLSAAGALAVALADAGGAAPVCGVVTAVTRARRGGHVELPPSWSWGVGALEELAPICDGDGRWRSLEAAAVPEAWVGVLRHRGISSVAWATVSDVDGTWGALLVCSERDGRRRSQGRALDDAIAALRAFRRRERELLARSDALVAFDRAGRAAGCSSAAEAWLSAQPRERRRRLFDRWTENGRREYSEFVSSAHVTYTPTPDNGGVIVRVTASRPVPALVGHQLSPRLREAAEYASAGATAREIARAMGISHETVRGYLKDVYRLLGVSNRVELARSLGSLH